MAKEYRWPCEQCGASLRYAPGQTHLVCEFCGHDQTIPAAGEEDVSRALQEHDLAKGLRDDLPLAAMEMVRTSRCPGCGAQIELLGAETATQCPFCATAVVLGNDTTRQIRPQALIPFVLSEREAREALTRWLGSLWFAPNGLLEYTRKGRRMNGVYVPYWTFDASTRSHYTGQRGEAYYETRTVTVMVDGKRQTRQEQVRKIRWYPASGRVARDFDDIVIIGSNSLPVRLGEELTPWDLSALVPYRPDYLAGFSSESYTVPLSAAAQQAKAKMAAVIAQDVRRDIGGDEQRITSIDTDFRNETFKHILLPVWMAAYKYNGKSYRFLVNGQTGEVQGERPWSIWKIAFAVLAALILAGIVMVLADGGGSGGFDYYDWDF